MDLNPGPDVSHRWLISYDMTNDRQRHRLAVALQGQATRWLYSAFCHTGGSPATISSLLDDLAPTLDGFDGLLVLRMCGDCTISTWGIPLERPFEGPVAC